MIFQKARNAIAIAMAALFISSVTTWGESTSIYSYAEGNLSNYVRIGLLYGDQSPQNIRIESESGFQLAQDSQGELTALRSLQEYTLLYVTREGGRIVVRDDADTVLSNDFPSDYVLISAAQSEQDRMISIENGLYRDGVCFRLDASGGLTVINYIQLEHYLYGVLSKEMAPNYPLEALKAQAVSARSFTYGALEKHVKQGFDLCNKTCCQVYSGIAAEFESTTQACSETEGQVISYEGKIATGYYHASSGGYTQNSEDVWVTTVPYLRAVADEFAPLAPWHTNISFQELQRRLKASSYDPGVIRSVKVEQRYDNGSVGLLRIEGSKDSVVLSKENIRTVIGGDVIRSVRFSMGAFPSPKIITESGKISLVLQSSNQQIQSSEAIYIIGSDLKSYKTTIGGISIWDGTSSRVIEETTGRRILFTDEAVPGDVVHFQGLGHGHGVGMPQTSAREMAYKGYDYVEILSYFYTGIEVVAADHLKGLRR